MITEVLAPAGNLVKNPAHDSLNQIDQMRKKATERQEALQPDEEQQKQMQPEELLTQIKALTEDGVYAVQFEKDRDMDELVVKIVDSKTDEIIRQIPSEEIMELTRQLDELRGNIVNTVT